MNANVTLFYDTKFDAANIPDSPALLLQFPSKAFNSIYVKQDRELINIKIEAIWDDVKNADYVELYTPESASRQYYFIVGINMLNDRTAMLSLLEDTITSVGGVSALTFIDGWATRLSVGSDGIFENVIEENFQPSEPMVISDMIHLGEQSSSNEESFGVVCSTTNLTQIEPVAVTYKDNEGVGSVTVPQMPAAAGSTQYTLQTGGAMNPETVFRGKINGMSTYLYDNEDVKAGIKNARSLGIEDTITACYQIPEYYGNALVDSDEDYVYDLVSRIKTETNQISVKFGNNFNPANNKVYAVMNTITLKSIAAQNSIEYKPWEIGTYLTSDNGTIVFITWADLSPTGKPYCRPLRYRGVDYDGSGITPDYLHLFDTGICGSNWRNIPITYNFVTAQQAIQSNINLQSAQDNYDMASLIAKGNNLALNHQDYMNGIRAASGVLSHGGQIVSGVGSLAKGDASGINQLGSGLFGLLSVGETLNYNNQKIANDWDIHNLQGAMAQRRLIAERFQYEMAGQIVVPKQVFPDSMSMVNWIGNGFIAYRTRLSDKDLERFDEYLTRFGYAVSEPLTRDKLFTRTNFNFVQANSVYVDDNNPDITNRRQEAIQSLFTAGVRIWHVKPSHDKLINNPIKEVEA